MLWRNIRFSSLLLIKWASLGQLFSVVEHQCPRIIVFSIFSYIFCFTVSEEDPGLLVS